MELAFECAHCETRNRQPVDGPNVRLACGGCDWSRELGPDDFLPGDETQGETKAGGAEPVPARCLVCGCDDLWRQKDFPPQLGLSLVALGALLSTIAWSQYRPLLAIGILMAFALGDLLLYVLMSDVLVCYRCEARHRRGQFGERHATFDLETAERYRQESLRLAEAAGRRS